MAVSPLPSGKRSKPPRLSRTERGVALLAVASVLVVAAALAFRDDLAMLAAIHSDSIPLFALFVLALLALAPRVMRRPRWRPLFGAGEPLQDGATITIRAPWVVDGDTIDDRATRTRYRLHNIDAPETGERAQSVAERMLGERAKWTAVAIIRNAKRVEARGTGRFDVYGRTVAYILVDGQDLGELLIKRGVALPWRGQREDWSALH